MRIGARISGIFPRRRAGPGLLLLLSLALMLGTATAGTLAWIVLRTQPIENTFVYGDIELTLTETDTNLDNDSNPNTNDYLMLPGRTIAKDPKVTVLAGSIDCWLFVELKKSDNFDDFLEYTVASGWHHLNGAVYYRELEQTDFDRTFPVFLGDTVAVKSEVSKQMLNDLDSNPGSPTYPTLTVTAYAVQKHGISTAQAAWAQAQALRP